MTLDRRIAVLALATFASGTEAYVYAGLLSDVAAELSVDVGRAGLLATGFAVTYAVSHRSLHRSQEPSRAGRF
jgi:predicted MFS family arabinose efflux permease